MLAVETHRRLQALASIASRLTKASATAFAVEAEASTTSAPGTNGGALAATLHGIRPVALPEASWTDATRLHAGRYLTGFHAPLDSEEQLLVCCAYHRSGYEAEISCARPHQS